MKKVILLVGLLFAIPLVASAQNRPMWRAELPGGNYDVLLSSIGSVSTHEYVLDRAVTVVEFTIATNTAVVARFYYIEPLKPNAPGGYGQGVLDNVQDKVTEATARVTGTANEPLLTGVVKTYPATTHAHTVEYRLQSRDDVTKMFKSVEDAWRQNKDTSYKP